MKNKVQSHLVLEKKELDLVLPDHSEKSKARTGKSNDQGRAGISVKHENWPEPVPCRPLIHGTKILSCHIMTQ